MFEYKGRTILANLNDCLEVHNFETQDLLFRTEA